MPQQNDFDQYANVFWNELHSQKNFNEISRGYAEWYYDCLPSELNAPILDIGCGSGQFLYFLQTSGYVQLEGLDLSFEQVEVARKHLACPVHHEETESFLQSRQGYYRLIALNDVLEHIPKNNIVSFLETIRKGLNADGSLVVSVPQAAGLTSLYTRYNDFTHQLVFTELSLKYVLRLAGFTKIRFIAERWKWKWTPRHAAFRLLRWCWFKILRLIYFIELPGQNPPSTWQNRIVAEARP